MLQGQSLSGVVAESLKGSVESGVEEQSDVAVLIFPGVAGLSLAGVAVVNLSIVEEVSDVAVLSTVSIGNVLGTGLAGLNLTSAAEPVKYSSLSGVAGFQG